MMLDFYRSLICVQVMVYLAAANNLLRFLELPTD
jgi:hypothetical protein